MIYDFVLLNAIRETSEVKVALNQVSDGIRAALKASDGLRASLKPYPVLGRQRLHVVAAPRRRSMMSKSEDFGTRQLRRLVQSPLNVDQRSAITLQFKSKLGD
jgi:hypothetical protein